MKDRDITKSRSVSEPAADLSQLRCCIWTHRAIVGQRGSEQDPADSYYRIVEYIGVRSKLHDQRKASRERSMTASLEDLRAPPSASLHVGHCRFLHAPEEDGVYVSKIGRCV
jgi:hypothetical protein